MFKTEFLAVLLFARTQNINNNFCLTYLWKKNAVVARNKKFACINTYLIMPSIPTFRGDTAFKTFEIADNYR